MTDREAPTHRNKRLGNGFIRIPHVVILGAGASKASFPSGDLNGMELPLMNNLVRVLGLDDLLNSNDIKYEDENFEVVFSNISNDPAKKELRQAIEDTIFGYFSRMKIPEELTIYDKLILSLREKDIVASFNWDPLLLYAYRRCGNYFKHLKIKLPEPVFLHGNVALGGCYKDKTIGPRDSRCSKCSKRFRQVPLLYPVLKKDYSSNPVIKEQWDILRYHIKGAYFITIFGYSAPKADTDAIKLMDEVWEQNPRKELAQIEIIDLKNRDFLIENWKEFSVGMHFSTSKNLDESYLFEHPRRSIEAFFDCFLQGSPWPHEPMPDSRTFEELTNWITPLLTEENMTI